MRSLTDPVPVQTGIDIVEYCLFVAAPQRGKKVFFCAVAGNAVHHHLLRVVDGELNDEDPEVTDPGPLHLPYSVIMPPQNTVPWPEPYKTLDNDNSYCPVKTFAELQAEKQAY